MKKISILFFFISSFAINAQEQKLFQESNHWGGFGGMNLHLNPSGNIAISGEGAWIFKNYFIGGFGLTSGYGSVFSPERSKNYDTKRSMGGVMIGAFSNNVKLISLFTELKIGFGDIILKSQLSPNTYEEFETNATTFTPLAGICITPREFIQFRIFGGYEYTSDFEIIGIGNEEMNGAVFGIGLYLGYF